jgi:EAL domain-containing protein (putative c-di-GMP-specific phosphodiesterase class I)
VVRNTLAQLCKWREEGLELPQLAINISPVQLQQPDFIENLLALLREFKVKPSQLQLELTETAVMEHIEYGLSQLQLLREAGFSIAIDDFGTGYSSLSYLIKLPVDVVKLDRSIINDIEHSLATQSMVRNVIRMSHELGISLVAEGIETKEQHDLLTLMNCNYAQGYLYSKPVDAGRFLQLAIQQPLAAILSGEQTDA